MASLSYGDPIDPLGHVRGFKNLSSLLEENGILYLSVPIGRERVEFNAHRVFDPVTPTVWARQNSLELVEFAFVGDDGNLVMGATVEAVSKARLNYGCGIYVFRKPVRESMI